MTGWEFAGFVLVGFAAQVIDGALGMAYGVTATTLLLSLGVPPAFASATVHLAECVTTGISGLTHRAFGNVDRVLFRKLILPGVIGAAASLSFILTLGTIHWRVVAGLALGGALGAPVGAWACKRLPTRVLMIGVGFLIVVLSLRNLMR